MEARQTKVEYKNVEQSDSTSHPGENKTSRDLVPLNIEEQPPAQGPRAAYNSPYRTYIWGVVFLITVLAVCGTIIAVMIVFTSTGPGDSGLTTTHHDENSTTNPIMSATIPTMKLPSTPTPQRTGTSIMECAIKTGDDGSADIQDLCWVDYSTLIVYGNGQLSKVSVNTLTGQCGPPQMITRRQTIRRLSCTDNNQVYALDNKNSEILIYNTQTGKFVSSWKPRHGKSPYTIATNKDYAVVSFGVEATLFVYMKDTKKFVKSVNITHIDFDYRYARNNTYRFADTYITNDNIVLIMSTSGHLLIHDLTQGSTLLRGEHGHFDGQLSHPRGVTAASDGTVLVADHDNNRMVMWSVQGAYLGVLWVIRDGGHISYRGWMFQAARPSVTTREDGTFYLAVRTGFGAEKKVEIFVLDYYHCC